MKRHGFIEIAGALEAIDRALDHELRLIVIGGAAVALWTRDATMTTKDVDTWQLGHGELARLAAALDGVEIDLGPASVADMPWDFEDRLVRMLPDLVRLHVFVPEPHDLSLSKVLRWSEGDELQIVRLHTSHPLNPQLLIERFRDDMSHVIGDPERHRGNLIDCVERLFGALWAARARDALA